MTGPRDPLRGELRAIADRFEAAAAPESTVAARLERRTRRPGPSVGLVTAAALAVLVAVLLGTFTPSPSVGPPVMPTLVGTFRTDATDANGRCYAVRLSETTAGDGRAFVWAWTSRDGCATRTSNLITAPARAAVLEIPASAARAARQGIRVTTGPTDLAPLGGLDVVLDPLAVPAGSVDIPGYRAVGKIGGAPTDTLHLVEVLDVPYVPG